MVLQDEWLAEQARIKAEFMTVVFGYWNGTGTRRTSRVRKGTTIGMFSAFLQAKQAPTHGSPINALMYVNEDAIVLHHLSFYYFIVERARSKGESSFSDAADNVRVISDISKAKADTHAGKVVDFS